MIAHRRLAVRQGPDRCAAFPADDLGNAASGLHGARRDAEPVARRRDAIPGGHRPGDDRRRPDDGSGALSARRQLGERGPPTVRPRPCFHLPPSRFRAVPGHADPARRRSGAGRVTGRSPTISPARPTTCSRRASIVSDQKLGIRDKYTSLMWLGGTAAWSGLNRPGDAMIMFDRYSRGGRSLQVLSKGLYWAGKAALSARRATEGTAYFQRAAAYPELFYGQLALERLGRPIPAPGPLPTFAVNPTQQRRNSRRGGSSRRRSSSASKIAKSRPCSSARWPSPSIRIPSASWRRSSASRSAARTSAYGSREWPASKAAPSTSRRPTRASPPPSAERACGRLPTESPGRKARSTAPRSATPARAG